MTITGPVGSFKFNNIESSSFGLICKSVSRPFLPAAKLKRVDIPGASGVFDFANTEYSNRPITMHIAYLGTNFETLRSQARLIAGWLSQPNWCKLVINDEPNLYYMAKVTNETNLATILTGGQADIIFDCLPFAYSDTGVVEDLEGVVGSYNNVLTFTNPGTKTIDYRCPQGSQSILNAIGTWTSLLIMRTNPDITVCYYKAQNASPHPTLEIDNVNMTVHMLTGPDPDDWTNEFGALTNGMDTFMPIYPGENVWTIEGADVNLDTFSVEYIPLWL